MITRDNGLRYAKLIHVSVDNGKTHNSNKVYIMEELSDSRIKIEYGRVGSGLTLEYKPSSKWNSVYKNKLSRTKGYTDVTELITENIEPQPETSLDSISDVRVRKLISDLMSYANNSIKKNYLVTQESVSEQQITTAQELITKLSNELKIGSDAGYLNETLLKLFTVIPRKMTNVKDYLFTDINDNSSLTAAQEILNNEQLMLDTMSGQVRLLKQQRDKIKTLDSNTRSENISILESMGVVIEVETDPDKLELINKLLGENKHRARGIFRVINLKTQERFDKFFKNARVKKKRLYWHGSRNSNFFNILQTGLLIKPACAAHTGSMFGNAIYTASSSQKSIGYTSLSGSYWARGNESRGYLALFDVHVGNQKHIYKHDSSCYNLNYSDLKREGYDSVFAHKGADLRNDEFMIYNSEQCTISYLIEIN